jgi:hypothetical protein
MAQLRRRGRLTRTGLFIPTILITTARITDITDMDMAARLGCAIRFGAAPALGLGTVPGLDWGSDMAAVMGIRYSARVGA